MRGLCRICTKPIKIGEQITRGATGRWVHPRCLAGVAARAGGSRFLATVSPGTPDKCRAQGDRDEMSLSQM